MSPNARFLVGVPLLLDLSCSSSSSPLLEEEGVSVGIGGSWESSFAESISLSAKN